MTEFKVQLDDSLVQTLGYSTIEKYLNLYLNQLILKISSKEVLNELVDINLENDDRWQVARGNAWKEQGYKYQRNLSH